MRFSGRCSLWKDQNFHSHTPNIVYLGRTPGPDARKDCPLSAKGTFMFYRHGEGLALTFLNMLNIFLDSRNVRDGGIFLFLFFLVSTCVSECFLLPSHVENLFGCRRLKIILSSKLGRHFVFWYLKVEKCLKQPVFVSCS